MLNLSSLPTDIWSHIFNFLERRDVLNMSSISKYHRKVVRHDVIWMRMTRRDFFTTSRKSHPDNLSMDKCKPFGVSWRRWYFYLWMSRKHTLTLDVDWIEYIYPHIRLSGPSKLWDRFYTVFNKNNGKNNGKIAHLERVLIKCHAYLSITHYYIISDIQDLLDNLMYNVTIFLHRSERNAFREDLENELVQKFLKGGHIDNVIEMLNKKIVRAESCVKACVLTDKTYNVRYFTANPYDIINWGSILVAVSHEASVKSVDFLVNKIIGGPHNQTTNRFIRCAYNNAILGGNTMVSDFLYSLMDIPDP